MATKKLLRALLVCLVLIPNAYKTSSAQDTLILMYDDLEPYVIMRGKQMTGFLATYLSEIASTVNIQLIWNRTHWDRQMAILRDGKSNVCAIGLYETKERKTYMRFSAPLGADHGLVLIGVENHKSLQKHQSFSAIVEDATLLPILQLDSTYGPYVNSLVKDKAFPITKGSLERIVRTLKNGTHDYMILTPLAAYSMRDRFDLAVYDHYSDLKRNLPYHLGCSKDIDDDMFSRLNAEIVKKGPAKPSKEN